MLAKRIVPCLDIKDGKTVKGINFVNFRDAGDPVELGAQYSREGADELVYLDITASHEGRKTFTELVKKVAANISIPFTVGGGINDAPALTAATVGCAIGSGSDIAIESADIVLMRSDLQDVPRALRLSALTLRDIKQNLFWAFCYNTIGIPIAAGLLYLFGGPLLSPMFAGAAMSLSSVCVVGNALRLGRAKL